MHIGSQLYAPNGFKSLEQGLVYHFLNNDSQRCRVLLVTFGAVHDQEESSAISPDEKSARVAFLRRDHFEEAIIAEQLLPCTTSAELPPWLGTTTIALLRARRSIAPELSDRHESRIDATLAHLWPAIERLGSILASEKPDYELNKIARASKPRQNLTRFRLAFYSYIAFGMNRWALHYSIQKIGKWDRGATEKKFGRPSIAYGERHGYSACSAEIRKKIIEGYRRFSGQGVHLREVFSQTMNTIFGCVTMTNAQKLKVFAQPNGEPIPTERQFHYVISKEFPLEDRQVIKFGYTRARNRLLASQGRFMEAVGYLMEKAESDAFMVPEQPLGFYEHSLLPNLWVVRSIDMGSGLITGIGFSVGSEISAAYRMAKACQLLDKVWFCSLFGVTIEADEWPSVGGSMHDIVDRGPGATIGAHARSTGWHPIIKELAPSHAGQSKASIETSHPKAVKHEGAPQHSVTSMTIPQLAAREIRRVIMDNQSKNIGTRLNNVAVIARVLPTPIHLWNYLSQMGRSLAVTKQRDEVIREYFTQVEVKVCDGVVYFMEQRFDSPALQDSGFLRIASTRDRHTAYILDVCVRHIFVAL
ncbi:hypothetical protein F2P44_30735 [Massilia sp. CCM 8695]|uniref:Transposase n=1 Tax=Massilia frigida TaxID=2609281 RepID=A0ABX0NDR6_9BURK|nr:hypothetical protein [Massilia frigida]NHZ83612.1 hypothetical protein [Massilia frigida]